MGFALFDGGSPDYASMAAQQEAKRQQAITQGTTAINNAYAGFTPAFYQQRSQAYQDYAMPQLEQQYTGTRNAIGFDLANRNLIGSGSSQNRFGDLAVQMATAKQGIIDTGQSQAQNLENQVQASKDTQLSNLYASADPAGAASSATSSAASFSQPSTFAALGNQFSSLLNQYYTTQLINSYRGIGTVSPTSGYSSGVNWPTTVQGGGY